MVRVENHYKLHAFIFTVLSILFFAISPYVFIPMLFAGMISTAVFLHMRKMVFEFHRWQEIVLFFIGNLYLTYAFFGFDLFINTRYQMPNAFISSFYFILCFIWTAYVFQSALDALKCLYKNRVIHSFTGNYWKKWLFLLAIMFTVFIFWQRAYNPIIIMPDSYNYLNYGSYETYRSPVYTFFIYIILTLAPTKPEVQWIAFTQIFTFSVLLSTILMYFHKKGLNFKYIILFAVVLPLIPSFGLTTIILLLDLATAMSVLWLTYVLVRIIDEVIIHKTTSNKQLYSYCLQLCISLVLCYFIRANSFVVYIVMAPVLALFFLIKKQRKLLSSVALSLLLVLLIRYPGYNALNVRKSAFQYEYGITYWAGIHDMQHVYYLGGRLSNQTLSMLNFIIPNLNETETIMNFYPLYNDFTIAMRRDYSMLTTGRFLQMYLDTFLRNPFKIIRSMATRVLMYWAITPDVPVSAIELRGLWDGETFVSELPGLGVSVQHSPFTNIMENYLSLMRNQYMHMFFWTFGFWISLYIINMVFLIQQKKSLYLIAYLPAFVFLAALYLVLLGPEFRYGFPIMLCCMFLPAISTRL